MGADEFSADVEGGEEMMTAAEANLALQETASKIQAVFRGKQGRKSAWAAQEEKFRIEEAKRLQRIKELEEEERRMAILAEEMIKKAQFVDKTYKWSGK